MSFDVAAEAYDTFMGRFSVPLAVLLADLAGVAPPGRALDVGCGTGALTRELVARLGAGGVAAVDPSDSFVSAVRERFTGVDVRHASAESLPYPDDAFDVTLAELVVHFMTDAAAGVREMVRVTRPGGVVAACVWDFAGARAPQTPFFRAFAAVHPDVEDETERIGGRRGDLDALLRRAGCHDVASTELSVQVAFPTFDEGWEPYTHGVAPAGRQLAALSPADRERVSQRARSDLGAGPIHIAATAWAAHGSCP